jgi:hypothetical protein
VRTQAYLLPDALLSELPELPDDASEDFSFLAFFLSFGLSSSMEPPEADAPELE